MIALRLLVTAALSVSWALYASASSIEYAATSLGGTAWRYDYTLVNDTSGVSVDEFSIYFEVGLYENLRLATGPGDWDLIVLQPDLGLPAAGLFDGLALAAPLGVGETLAGFSVQFDFLGAGAPGSQSFEFLDSLTLASIDRGFTEHAGTSNPIPEPRSWLAFGVGLIIVGFFARSSRPIAQHATTTRITASSAVGKS